VQKQRADNQQRAAEAAKHKRKPAFTQGRLRHAQHSQQGQNEAAGEQAPGPQGKKTRSVARRRTRCNWWHPAVIIPVLGVRRRGVRRRGSEEGGNEEKGWGSRW